MDKIGTWFSKQGIVQERLEEFIEHYDGAMKQRYQIAFEVYQRRGVFKSDAKVKSFVKMERVPNYVDPFLLDGSKCSDPRIIHPRKPVYNLVLGSYLRPVEQAMTKYKRFGLRVNLKGLDLFERARLVLKHEKLVGDCLVYELDGKRWDGHVNSETLREEHKVYKYVYKSRELRELLSMQFKNYCTTSTGYKYTITSRCSGDYNTSLGNHLINEGLVESYMVDRYGDNKSWSYVCDGDNLLLFVHRSLVVDRPSLEFHYRAMGQEVSLVGPKEPRDLEFCRGRIYHGPNGPVFTRDPRRVLGGILTVYQYLDKLDDYYHSILECESHVSAGVPMIQEFVNVCRGQLRPRGTYISKYKLDYKTRMYQGKGFRSSKYSVTQLTDYLALWDIEFEDYINILMMIKSFRIKTFDRYEW